MYPPLIGNAANAAANYMIRNHLNTAFDSLGQKMRDFPEITQALLTLTLQEQSGPPAFKKHKYSLSENNATHENIMNATGLLLQWFSDSHDYECHAYTSSRQPGLAKFIPNEF